MKTGLSLQNAHAEGHVKMLKVNGTIVPSIIQILGQEFTVQVENDPETALDVGAPGGAVAVTRLNRQIIRIRGGGMLSTHQTIDSIIHEALHAMFKLHGFNVYLAQESAGHSEHLIDALAPALYAMLHANRELVEMIQDG